MGGGEKGAVGQGGESPEVTRVMDALRPTRPGAAERARARNQNAETIAQRDAVTGECRRDAYAGNVKPEGNVLPDPDGGWLRIDDFSQCLQNFDAARPLPSSAAARLQGAPTPQAKPAPTFKLVGPGDEGYNQDQLKRAFYGQASSRRLPATHTFTSEDGRFNGVWLLASNDRYLLMDARTRAGSNVDHTLTLMRKDGYVTVFKQEERVRYDASNPEFTLPVLQGDLQGNVRSVRMESSTRTHFIIKDGDTLWLLRNEGVK